MTDNPPPAPLRPSLRPPRLGGRTIRHWGLRAAAATALALALLPPTAALTAAAAATQAPLAPATLLLMLADTALYVGGVLILALALALPTAWAVAMHDFPGRRLATWLLLLPFALPPYITAYAADSGLRAMGWRLPGGLVASAATALAVYPYIFLLARAALLRQQRHLLNAARLLGCSPLRAFWRISLPLARPAIAVGAALAAMETMNDIAIAEHFGLHTLGAGIYDLWLNRGDFPSAARLAALLTALILLILWAEESARKRQAQYATAGADSPPPPRPLRGAPAAALWLCLLLPTAGGFWLPTAHLLHLAASAAADDWQTPLATGLSGSLTLAGLLATTLCAAAALLALDKRANPRGAAMRAVVRAARAAYAVPGAVIAQGLFALAAAIYAVTQWQILASGGIAVLLLACAARFFMIAGGALETAIDRIPPHLDSAARLAGHTPWGCFWRIHLPLLRPAATAAAILVFVESVKELPMTLILRPFNFDTLATIVYQYASDEALELAAPSALLLALLTATAITLLFCLEQKRTAPPAGRP